ncbi:MAG TPA: ABC transporter permease [Haliscomenobacter sp.]|uniref:ABC transporter permease n=1 Tax=Haliscomenobacter sp. TaxID=2717303 RepID=UPI002D0430D3|nr:ABC transporter permease [Haliscomenobacter sp.]HOY19798.1 ABC transporter permease [Haliscomenobacter sp.]
MIQHFFKLIWNKKRSNALLIVEILVAFLVLFGVMSLLTYNYQNYSKPLGFNYDNVWALNISTNQDTSALTEKFERIFQRVLAYPEVQSASKTRGNTPFANNQSNRNVVYNKTTIQGDIYNTDEHYAKTLGIELAEGRWYNSGDLGAKYTPAVINRLAKDKLFGNENPLGKVIKLEGDERWKIVGIVENFKQRGEYQANTPAFFNMEKEVMGTILLKVKPGTDANFEAKLMRQIGGMQSDWTMEVSYLSNQRKSMNQQTAIPSLIFSIVCGFFLLNVALGLFGVLTLNIAKRKDEIGLRRALGATGKAITAHFVGEMWVIATLGVVVGVILAIQFPILNVFDLDSSVYIVGILLSVLTVYLLVTLCALYPSMQASRIQPATALHEE